MICTTTECGVTQPEIQQQRWEAHLAQESDSLLLQRIGAGDRHAFTLLVDRHKDALVGYLRMITGYRDRAEDLAQETFLRVFLHAKRYQEQGKPMAYLLRIATNLARSEARREQRKSALFKALRLSGLKGLSGGNSSDPQDQLQEKQVGTILQRAIKTIPLRYRTVLVLNTVEDLSYREIAGVVGCREGTVKSRISRGRQLLKKKLENGALQEAL